MNFKKKIYLKSMHLVLFSPWPFCTAMSLLGLTLGNVFWWHKFKCGFLLISMILLILISFLWWSDVSFENQQGFHKMKILSSLRLSMLLFMVSEVFFFFSFFWSFFHKCWSPSSQIGFFWPPFQFSSVVIDPFSMPFLKTIILLSSGSTMTWCHYNLIKSNFFGGLISLLFTMILGVFFLFLQMSEYIYSDLSMKSTMYGSSFFLLTGFHGFHVTIGTLFLIVSFFRFFFFFFSNYKHVSFELCAWYWHFVDVIWMFLYFFLYWYGFFCLQV